MASKATRRRAPSGGEASLTAPGSHSFHCRWPVDLRRPFPADELLVGRTRTPGDAPGAWFTQRSGGRLPLLGVNTASGRGETFRGVVFRGVVGPFLACHEQQMSTRARQEGRNHTKKPDHGGIARGSCAFTLHHRRHGREDDVSKVPNRSVSGRQDAPSQFPERVKVGATDWSRSSEIGPKTLREDGPIGPGAVNAVVQLGFRHYPQNRLLSCHVLG